jgi:hypothetical protein
MFSTSGSGGRSTLEEMLDSMRTGETEEKGVLSDETREDLPPLPSRPTSRARLPSTVRAKKALGSCLDNLAVPKTGSEENIPLDSPVANLVAPADPDLASGNAHTPLAKDGASFPSPQLSSSPSVIPDVSTPAEPSRGALSFEDRINAAGAEQPCFSFLTAQESSAAPPTPQTPAPPQSPVPQDPALPVTTPSSAGKKWKDDGTLRLKKVY